MKRAARFFLVILCGLVVVSYAVVIGALHVSRGEPEESRFACLDSTHVVVEVLSKPLPSHQDTLEAILWRNYIDGPLGDQFKCRVGGWEQRAKSFARSSLVRQASADSLDAQSLARCLDAVLADAGNNAYLPIQADSATFEGVPVWVILVKWEWANSSSQEVLSHAGAYVLDARDAHRLCFATCS